MRHLSRLLSLIVLTVLAGAAHIAPALASGDQEAIFQDGPALRSDPVNTLATLQQLGVTRLRLLLPWNTVAPSAGSRHKPKRFNAADPGSYPSANWSIYDTIVRTAQADGIAIDLTLTGPAPLWATGSGAPSGGPHPQWKPAAGEYGSFVRAVGTRYSGTYKPRRASARLPRVSFWAIWNEPNYGPALAPQATDNDTIEVGAVIYRRLVGAAWGALHATGHGHDTILIGETAPRGLDHPIGDFSGVKPLRFIRALYCVSSSYRPLRGSAATARGCPTTASGSRRFRAANPGLFEASGFADHPYAQGVPPNTPTYACGRNVCTDKQHRSDPDYADLAELPRLERVLDRLQRVYGSHARLPIWSTEYGYQTNPPERTAKISPATAAYYINWAEYLSWRQSRVGSYAQYLLVDPPLGNFASGLELPNGKRKVTFDAYRLPVLLPVTSTRRGRALEVWGCARPAHVQTGSQQVQIQFRSGSHGAFKTVRTVAIRNRRGYFDVQQTFAASGSVRLAWRYPAGATIHSRTVGITVR
jgi:hypothetical protein